MKTKQSFYSHGKLLLTGEYLVLDGSNALAIPTRLGQWLYVNEIEEVDSKLLHWKSMDHSGNCWFETEIHFETPENANPDHKIHNTLLKILNTAKQLNPKFLSEEKGYYIETKLEFNSAWGLGSSSTLINNIAQWANVNAYELLEKSFGGSGYDIACAKHHKPIVYKRNLGKPIVTETDFDPPFKENLFFIYLNQKQDSKASIKHYQSLPIKDFDTAEKKVNEITEKMIECTDLETFEILINTHEEIISKIIKTPTVKSRLFPDYHNSLKSLGGWGGDFVLATGSPEDMSYFKDKGYTTIIPYSEMVYLNEK
ncbi:GYDIA family GHMP kinase [Aquimarina pacifica]|uniref:GYDIA family GHMP kinase n=1 Tax=Aquimarina pacifica TaxID=1296415 RepID=UPI000472A553|nr:GYDIA family GHMP kinase [Aquimarina pacifica]